MASVHDDVAVTSETAAAVRAVARRRTTWRQDLIASVLALWLVLGMFLDGRAHLLGLLQADNDSFFSLWHFILYSGFAALSTWVLTLSGGLSAIWRRSSIPPGYGLALLAIPLFLLSGGADLVWHLLWGFENGLQSAMSPPHVLLFSSGVLLITGPLRAGWAQGSPRAPSFVAFLPVLLTTGTALAVIVSWSSSLMSPLPWTVGSSDPEQLNLLDLVLYQKVLLANLLLMSATLLVLKLWRPPFGSFTVIYSLVGLLVGLEDSYSVPGSVPALLVAGIAADVAVRFLAPSPQQRRAFLLAGAAIPALLWSCYFAGVALTQGLRWSHQMWSGSILLAALSGCFLAFLVAAPNDAERLTPAGPG